MKNIIIAIVTIIILRESEGELLDNSGMSISYCEGTAHSLPLVGSPRFADSSDDDVTAFKDETAD